MQCPQCDRTMNGSLCGSCGYTVVPRQRGPQSYVWAPIDPKVLAKMKEAFAKPKPHPRAWAQRILEREGRGERVPLYAVECAGEAVRGMPAMREPGQEG